MSQAQEVDFDYDKEYARNEGTEIIELYPHEIQYPGDTHVRQWSDADSKLEMERIKELAETIAEHGQLQPGKVMETADADGNLQYHLIMGRRRVKAIELLNSKGHDRRFKATIARDVTPDQAFLQAVIENMHRENPNAMDTALNIKEAVERFGWTEVKDWSKKVAQLFHVSRAYVTQHMKLLDLPQEIQDRLAAKEIEVDAAIELASVKPETQAEVLKVAEEIASAKPKKAKAARAAEEGGEPTTAKPAKAALKLDDVVKATREVDESRETPKVRTRNEMLSDLEALNGPGYGWANSPVRAFLTYFVDKYAKGIGTSSTMVKKFDAMLADAHGEGTPTKAEQQGQEAEAEPVVVEVKVKAKAKKKAKAA